ncbi:MAG: N-acetylornithine carbamoyltransferase [Planctomycetes bacterium]|nr:N-acetylornithine carbamoyltransferase [Planctomycetota bacterium]
MNGLYHLAEIPTPIVERLVARALELRLGAPAKRFPGRALGLLFFNPSLRTQASFQRAGGKMGLDLVQLSGGAGGVWGIETREGVVMDSTNAEHVREAAGVLGRFVDILAVRAFAQGLDIDVDRADPLLNGFRRYAGVPVINMESVLYHPCQALADWTTMNQLEIPRKAKFVLTWAWHPKSLPLAVPHSTLTMAAQRGMEVVVHRPKGFDLLPSVMEDVERLAAASGGSITVSDKLDSLHGADVVYAKSWGSLDYYGKPVAEAQNRAPLRSWQVTRKWMEAAGPRARFFHCLPVRRNVVVADEVIDSSASSVLEQAENRLHAQIAVLESILESRKAK